MVFGHFRTGQAYPRRGTYRIGEPPRAIMGTEEWWWPGSASCKLSAYRGLAPKAVSTRSRPNVFPGPALPFRRWWPSPTVLSLRPLLHQVDQAGHVLQGPESGLRRHGDLRRSPHTGCHGRGLLPLPSAGHGDLGKKATYYGIPRHPFLEGFGRCTSVRRHQNDRVASSRCPGLRPERRAVGSISFRPPCEETRPTAPDAPIGTTDLNPSLTPQIISLLISSAYSEKSRSVALHP